MQSLRIFPGDPSFLPGYLSFLNDDLPFLHGKQSFPVVGKSLLPVAPWFFNDDPSLLSGNQPLLPVDLFRINGDSGKLAGIRH